MFGKKHNEESLRKISQAGKLRTKEEFELEINAIGFESNSEYLGEEYSITVRCMNCKSVKTLKQAKNARDTYCKICCKMSWQIGGRGGPGRNRKYGFKEVNDICAEHQVKFLDDKYESIDSYHFFQCHNGHKYEKPFSEMLRSFKRGSNGCQTCVHEGLKKDINVLKTEYHEIGLEFLDDFYVNCVTKHNTRCLKCNHEWRCAPYSILLCESRCPKCNLCHNEKLSFCENYFQG